MADNGPSPIVPTQSASTSNPQSQPHESTDKSKFYFTQDQFAVALSIQQSKPEGLSMREFCSRLQRAVKPYRPIVNDSHCYVDTHEFWKDQYTKIYEEKKALEDRVFLLEQVHRTQQVDSPDADDEVDLNENGKRPAILDEITELLDTQDDNAVSIDSTVLRLCRYILQLGKRRGQLSTMVKESNSPEYLDNLVKSSDQLLGLMEMALDNCIIHLWALKCTEDTRTVHLIQQLMHQIISAFQTCFHALNKLCLTILGRSKRSGIVYRLVMFFKKALEHLQAICTLQAEHEDAGKRSTRSKRIKTGGEYATNKYLCQALISIAQTEWRVGKAGHSEVLEGILFSILDHTGRLVSNAVFDEHVATSNKPGNITLDTSRSLPGSANLEARYFVPILHAAIGGTETRKELLARVLSDRPGNSKNGSILAPVSSRHDLFLKARKRLQETLIKQAMGGEELDSLSLPTRPDDVDCSPPPSNCAEKYGPEWLLESVWAVLGWELAI